MGRLGQVDLLKLEGVLRLQIQEREQASSMSTHHTPYSYMCIHVHVSVRMIFELRTWTLNPDALQLSHSSSSLLGGAVASVMVNGMIVVTLGYIGNHSQTNEIYIIICHQLMIFIGFQGYHVPSEHTYWIDIVGEHQLEHYSLGTHRCFTVIVLALRL